MAIVACVVVLAFAKGALDGYGAGQVGMTAGLTLAIGVLVYVMATSSFRYSVLVQALLYVAAALALWVPDSREYLRYRLLQREVGT